MKITTILYRHNYHKLVKRLWAKQSQLQIAPLQVSPELQQLGVKIYDALDVVKEPNSYDIPPVEQPTELLDSSALRKFFLFHIRTRTTETEDQALCLTKTVSYPELPSILKSLIDVEQLPNQDRLVQQCITQALILDSLLIKLPKVIDVTNPGRVFARDFGAPFSRKVANVTKKLSFLCEMCCGKYPESYERHKILDPISEVTIEKKEDNETLVFQIHGDILFTSRKPLKCFASPSEVEATQEIELPSLYPIKPTLDLEQHEVNPAKHADDINLPEFQNTSSFHVHTLHIIHKSSGFWFPYQKLSKAIVSCFTYAAEEARRLYGNDVKILPQPICIQCIHSDLTDVGFLAYQLNTLDFSTNSGIKNQVWIEAAQPFYKVIMEPHTRRVNEITDYNSTIFPKMLTFYLNGVHPSCL